MKKYVASHLLRVKGPTKQSPSVKVLNWGDEVEVAEESGPLTKILYSERVIQEDGGVTYEKKTGWVASDGLEVASRILKVNVVDVQQGDGMVIECPDGTTVLIDGGDNKLFARYLASRFRCHDKDNAKLIDAILITHGDADHFTGLTDILESEKHKEEAKRLFIWPKRVFHNGLVKRPSSGRKDVEMLGQTIPDPAGGLPVITELVDQITTVPDSEMNVPFKAWKKTILAWNSTNRPAGKQPTHEKRLEQNSNDMDFLAESLKNSRPDSGVTILGPILTHVDGSKGLKFLGEPIDDPAGIRFSNSASASHTINGHSVILKVKFGNVRFIFAGDLNAQAESAMLAHPEKLETEVLKVPHHGSADYSPEFLKACAPLISVISSGDESAKKEFIHPRANLLGSLGRAAPVDRPVIFCTELAAFFEMKGWSVTLDKDAQKFFGFSRAAFGMVRIRTDGDVVVVTTDSARPTMKEAYAFRISVDATGKRVITELEVEKK